MTTTYELYTNENGTPKAVEGKAPAIIERVENLETSVETAQATADACLPLSGGTITGALTLANDAPRFNLKNSKITKGDAPSSSQYTDIEFLDANGARFATITSTMASNGSGLFSFWHTNASGAQSKALQLGIDANGNDVFAFGGKEAERVNVLGQANGYIRYESGLQICFGDVNATKSGTAVTYPVAFKSQWARIAISSNSGEQAETNASAILVSAGSLKTTGFKAYSSQNEYCNWIAIGWWK